MKDIGFLKTTDGDEIKITQDMLEDFYVISSTYNVSVRDLISNVFDGEWINSTEA